MNHLDNIELAARQQLYHFVQMRESHAMKIRGTELSLRGLKEEHATLGTKIATLKEALALALSSTTTRDMVVFTALNWEDCGGECKRTLCDLCVRLQRALRVLREERAEAALQVLREKRAEAAS